MQPQAWAPPVNRKRTRSALPQPPPPGLGTRGGGRVTQLPRLNSAPPLPRAAATRPRVYSALLHAGSHVDVSIAPRSGTRREHP